MMNEIILGDAYKLIKEVPSKSVDLIITDPPYDLIDTGSGCFGNEARNYHAEYGSICGDDALKMAKKEDTCGYQESVRMIKIRKEISAISYSFDYSILSDMIRVCKIPNIYVWCSRSQLRRIIDFFDDAGLSIDLLEWHKTNPIPTCGSSYLHDTELCVFARGKGVVFNKGFDDKKHYFISKTNKEDKNDFKHPTIKPLEFIKSMIRNSSNEGGVVLDPFCGSGTTCMAAKELGRKYLGFEINERWHKIAVDRLNGIDANGQTSIFTDFGKLT